jgi:LPXTG-motif cell wall anchor domain protein
MKGNRILNRKFLFTKSRETQARPKMVKTAAYGLVSAIALAGFISSTGVAQAEEKVAEPTATATAPKADAPKADAPKLTAKTEPALVTKETPKADAKKVDDKKVVDRKVDDKAKVDAKDNKDAKDKSENKVKSYDNLEKIAKDAKVPFTKEEEKTHNSEAEAQADLQKQADELAALIKERDVLNKQLAEFVKKAEETGITVKMADDVLHESTDLASKDIKAQVEHLQGLISLVQESRTRLNTAVSNAKAKGVRFEGLTTIDFTDGNVEAFKKKLSEAEAKIAAAVKTQADVVADTTVAIKNTENKGVTVTVKGEQVLAPAEVQAALTKFKAKLADAVISKEAKDKAYKEVVAAWEKLVADGNSKVEADYQATLADFNKRLKAVEDENLKITKANEDITNQNKVAKSALTKDSTAKVNADGSYTQTLVGKSSTQKITDTKVNHKPMDLVALVDFSSSFQSKRTQALNTLKTLIQTNLTDEDGVMLQGYIFNKEESYAAHGSQLNFAKLRNADWETGFSTKLLSKKDALSIIDKWVSVGAPGSANGTATFTAYFNEIASAMGDFGYKTDEKDGDGFVKKIPFEDVYSSQPNKKKLVSVVQFTDGWAETESMDATFANWAKDNAKTFMTIVNRNNLSTDDNNDTYSIDSMKKLGHPNIYDMTGKKDDVVMKEVLEQFKNTATEVTTTTSSSTSKANVTITSDAGVTLVSANLVSPSGKKQALEVKDNKVVYTGNLAEFGDYKVEYTFKSSKNEKGQVLGTFKVNTDGDASPKTISNDSKTDKFEATKLKDTAPTKSLPTDRPTKGTFTPPEKPKAPAPTVVEVPNLVVKTATPQVGKVETQVHKVNVSTKLHPVGVKVVPKTGSESTVGVKTLPKTGSESNLEVEFLAGLGLSFGLLGLVSGRRKEEA